MRLPLIPRRRLLAGLLAAGCWLAFTAPAPAFYWAAWPGNKVPGGGGGGGGGTPNGGPPGGGGPPPSEGGPPGGGPPGGGPTPQISPEVPVSGFTEGGSDSFLTPAAAPEPSALVLGLLGVGTAWAVRRVRKG